MRSHQESDAKSQPYVYIWELGWGKFLEGRDKIGRYYKILRNQINQEY